jgi:hypothetical protein
MLSMGQPDVKGIYMVDNFMEDSFFFSIFLFILSTGSDLSFGGKFVVYVWNRSLK